VNYSLKVVELVSLLLVVNYVVDFMNVCDIVLCMIYPEYSAYFGCSPSNEAAKIGNGKKIKLLYSSVGVTGRLRGLIYSLVGATGRL
jgi:hypothetical protein